MGSLRSSLRGIKFRIKSPRIRAFMLRYSSLIPCWGEMLQSPHHETPTQGNQGRVGWGKTEVTVQTALTWETHEEGIHTKRICLQRPLVPRTSEFVIVCYIDSQDLQYFLRSPWFVIFHKLYKYTPPQLLESTI